MKRVGISQVCVWNLFSRKRLSAESRRRIPVVFRGFEDAEEEEEVVIVAEDNDEGGGSGGRERGKTGAWGFCLRRRRWRCLWSFLMMRSCRLNI